MREILFRGKRIDNGDWVEGFYCRIQNDDCSYSHYIMLDTTRHISNVIQTVFDVIPETVGQYTGRTSQCTDRIFEHDRCMVTTFDHEGADYQHECVVIWDNGCLVFSNDEIWIPVAEMVDTDTDVKIIGNIHDDELSENSHD